MLTGEPWERNKNKKPAPLPSPQLVLSVLLATFSESDPSPLTIMATYVLYLCADLENVGSLELTEKGHNLIRMDVRGPATMARSDCRPASI